MLELESWIHYDLAQPLKHPDIHRQFRRTASASGNLENINTALKNLAGSPAEPSFQGTLAESLAKFTEGAEKLRATISPSGFAAISELGGKEFFDPAIAKNVRQVVQSNAMTPSVARDAVKDLAGRRASFLAIVKATLEGLEQLGVRAKILPPGAADIAFLIPRELFENKLEGFAKQLTFISRLVEHVTESTSGEVKPVKLETLSSSIPTITLDVAPVVISTIAAAVDLFLTAWEKIEKIRRVRNEAVELGVSKTAVEDFEQKITTTVDEVVEESTTRVMVAYSRDAARKNELSNAVRQDMRRLFGQVERGLTIEVRAEPETDSSDPGTKQTLDTIRSLAQTMQFPAPSGQPLLLSEALVIEGELQTFKKVRKSQTTTTTKTTKKVTSDTDAENH